VNASSIFCIIDSLFLFKSLMGGSYYKFWIAYILFLVNNNGKIFDFSLFLFASFEHKLLAVCNTE